MAATEEQKGSVQGTKHHWEAPNPGSDIRTDSLFFQRSLSRSPKTGRSWSSAHSLSFLWPKLTPKAWWVKFFSEMQPCHEGFQRDNCICLSKWFGSKTWRSFCFREVNDVNCRIVGSNRGIWMEQLRSRVFSINLYLANLPVSKSQQSPTTTSFGTFRRDGNVECGGPPNVQWPGECLKCRAVWGSFRSKSFVFRVYTHFPSDLGISMDCSQFLTYTHSHCRFFPVVTSSNLVGSSSACFKLVRDIPK